VIAPVHYKTEDIAMSALERIRNTLAAPGGEHLGDLTWWTLADARVSRADLEQVWTAAGLDSAHLPEEPTPVKAMKLAARAAAIGQADRLVRLGLEDERQIVHAIVREHRHEDGSVSFTQEARVFLERASAHAMTDVPGHDLAEAVLGKYSELKDTHPPDDVRRAMMNVLASCAAVTLREHGGIYWIPAAYSDTLRHLQSAIEKIGNSKLYLLPVNRSADASRTLGAAAKSAIEDELAALKAEVEGFLAQPPDRVSTLVRRLDAFEALKARANLYKDVLQVHVADLESTLANLAASVEQLLDQKAAA
jgi:hypothetical protein